MWAHKQWSTEATPYLLGPDSSEGNRTRAECGEAVERDTQEMKSTVLVIRKFIMPRSAVETKPCYRVGRPQMHSCGRQFATTAKREVIWLECVGPRPRM